MFGPVGPATDPSSLLARVGVILQEKTGSSTSELSAARLLSNMNAAYVELNQMATHRPNANLLTYANLTSDSSTGLINWTWNQFRGRMVAFRRRTQQTGDEAPNGMDEVQTQRADCMNNYINSGWGCWQGWASAGINERNGLLYAQNTTHTTWRAWYLRRPRPLFYGYAAGGSTTTITLPETATEGQVIRAQSDFYKDETFIVTPSVEGVPTYQQVARCTAFDIDTRIAEVRSTEDPTGDAFATAVQDGDPVSNQPWFDQDFWELLCLMTARRFSKRATATDFDDEIRSLRGQFADYLKQDDMFSQRGIVNNGNFDCGFGQFGPNQPYGTYS